MTADHPTDHAQPDRPMLVNGFGLVQQLRPQHLTEFRTAEPDVFSVWHLGIPDVDRGSWQLTVGGLVQRRLTLTLGQLADLPQTTVTSVHECAGSPLVPTIPQRRVANVTWTGVRLAEVLERAGVEPTARYIISTGHDHGVYNHDYHDRYEKDLPLSEAVDGQPLLALTINGQPIPARRGGPVRLVVPGYYGTNSTKWLTHLDLSADRSRSAFTTRYYMDPPATGDGDATPVWKIAPNSVLVAPTDGSVHAGRPVTIWGWAWAHQPVSTVDITTDGGHTWQPADLEPRTDRSWQRFTHLWTPTSVGEHVLGSRASTADATQPSTPRRNQVHSRYIFVTPSPP